MSDRITIAADHYVEIVEERDQLAKRVTEQQKVIAWQREQLQRAKADLERVIAVREVA